MFLFVLAVLGLQHLYWCQAEIYVFRYDSNFYFQEFTDVAAAFGPDLSSETLRGLLVKAEPPSACDDTLQPPPLPPLDEDTGREKWVLVVPRYTSEKNCTFEQKIRMAQLKGYDAVIVHNVGSNDLERMTANNVSGIEIPSVFVGESSGLMLRNVYVDPSYFVLVTAETPFNIQTHLLIPFAIAVVMCFVVMLIFMIVKYIKDRRRQRRYRLPKSQLSKIPTCKFQKGDRYETCAVCLEDYVEGEKLRVLPCNHVYHMKCIDPWLTKNKRVCPICKRKVFAHNEPHPGSDSDSETENDTTPLIRSGARGTQGGTFEVQNENPLRRAARSISQVLDGRHFVTSSDNYSINTERQSRPSAETSSTGTSSTSSDGRPEPNIVPEVVDFTIHNSDHHDDDGPHHHHHEDPHHHDDDGPHQHDDSGDHGGHHDSVYHDAADHDFSHDHHYNDDDYIV